MGATNVLFMDGFDHGALAQKWDTVAAGLAIVAGFNGTNGVTKTGSDAYTEPWLLKRVSPATPASGIIGYRSKASALPYSGLTVELSCWQGSRRQWMATHENDGRLTIRRGDYNGPVLGTTTVPTIANGVYKHTEITWTIHNSLGAIEVRSDNNTVLTLPNLNLLGPGASAQWDGFEFIPGTTEIFDDIYIGDQRAGWRFMGKGFHVRTLRPLEDIAAQFLPIGSASRFANVDDGTPDAFASENRGRFAGERDLFRLEALSSTYKKVLCTQANVLAKKASAGSGTTLEHVLRYADLDTALAAEALTGGTTPRVYRGIRGFAPDGSDLTVDTINASRWGYGRAA